MSSVESELVRTSYRLYAFAELKDACGRLIGKAPTQAPVKVRPLWLQGSLSELRQAKKREYLRHVMNQELGLILQGHPNHVRGVRPMRVEHLELLNDDVLDLVAAEAEARSADVSGALLELLEPSLNHPDATDSLAISESLHQMRAGVEIADIARRVVDYAPVPNRDQSASLSALR